MTQEILVLGATGKTGRRVISRLQARDARTRAGSRSGNPPFDWDDPDTWEPALRGTSAAYLTFQPDLAIPGTADTIAEFARLATKSGVNRLVLLSGRGEPEAARCEQAVRDSGAATTIIRASWFSQNFSEGHLLDPVLAGVVALPGADVPEPFVDVDDIADIAVAALTEPGHAGETYEVTGPRLITFTEAIAEIAAAADRELTYLPVTPTEYRRMLIEAGLPNELADQLMALFSEVLDGRNAHLTDGVQRALGREPRDFTDYVRATAPTGIWSSR
ncbi:MAG TPA: NmrA family transcriptional regulator [Actinophytocola sp.]|uniref:NmrA family transcriptional regulator n=1 Tax=Actinophytocola sp. TaxID=1872138 RepID=UPI002DFB640A|nr:NmrA family transcriptional regulator [Actinophytocola sp.]